MPVFRSGEGLAPEWCEMEYFDVVRLSPGDSHRYARMGEKEKLIVVGGKCRLAVDASVVEAEAGSNLDIVSPGATFEVLDVQEETVLVRMCGRWGDEVGGSGVFRVKRTDVPRMMGDPVDYPKETYFDNHYHDRDEYWVFCEGRGVVVSEKEFYEIGPGDCLATGMGHHHDISSISEPMVGVYFETTMEGQKRSGHLWEHTHGPAEPRTERV